MKEIAIPMPSITAIVIAVIENLEKGIIMSESDLRSDGLYNLKEVEWTKKNSLQCKLKL